MSVSIFDKILRIIEILVSVLRFAVRAFTGAQESDEEAE